MTAMTCDFGDFGDSPEPLPDYKEVLSTNQARIGTLDKTLFQPQLLLI
jgi:hypothetical protein